MDLSDLKLFHSRSETLREEGKDLVAGGNRRLTGFVDQVSGHHAVRVRHVLSKKWSRVGICRAVRKHAADEAIAERSGEGREPLRPADLIALEAITHHSQVVPLKALPNRSEFIRGNIKAGGIIERQ